MIDGLAAKKNIEQVVYVPIYKSDNISTSNHEGHNILDIGALKWYDKFLPGIRSRRLYNSLSRMIDLDDIDIVHSHYTGSTGDVAIMIKQKHKAKALVAFRNTDWNDYYQNILWKKKVISTSLNADLVITISWAYYNRLINVSAVKTITVPNPIDDFFIENTYENKTYQRHDAIFVGDLNHNKNIKNVIKAFLRYSQSNIHSKLHVCGQGPIDIPDHPNIIIHGRVPPRELIKLYRQSEVLILPSHHETFGLVYIEALSQGCKVIGTKNQGIYGFELSNTFFVNNANSVEELTTTIFKAFSYNWTPNKHEILRFSKNEISNDYLKLYESISKHNC